MADERPNRRNPAQSMTPAQYAQSMRRGYANRGPLHWVTTLPAATLPFAAVMLVASGSIVAAAALAGTLAAARELTTNPRLPWVKRRINDLNNEVVEREAKRISALDRDAVLPELERMSKESLDQKISPVQRWLNGGKNPPLFTAVVTGVWDRVLEVRGAELDPSAVKTTLDRVQAEALKREPDHAQDVTAAFATAHQYVATRGNSPAALRPRIDRNASRGLGQVADHSGPIKRHHDRNDPSRQGPDR